MEVTFYFQENLEDAPSKVGSSVYDNTFRPPFIACPNLHKTLAPLVLHDDIAKDTCAVCSRFHQQRFCVTRGFDASGALVHQEP